MQTETESYIMMLYAVYICSSSSSSTKLAIQDLKKSEKRNTSAFMSLFSYSLARRKADVASVCGFILLRYYVAGSPANMDTFIYLEYQ